MAHLHRQRHSVHVWAAQMVHGGFGVQCGCLAAVGLIVCGGIRTCRLELVGWQSPHAQLTGWLR